MSVSNISDCPSFVPKFSPIWNGVFLRLVSLGLLLLRNLEHVFESSRYPEFEVRPPELAYRCTAYLSTRLEGDSRARFGAAAMNNGFPLASNPQLVGAPVLHLSPQLAGGTLLRVGMATMPRLSIPWAPTGGALAAPHPQPLFFPSLPAPTPPLSSALLGSAHLVGQKRPAPAEHSLASNRRVSPDDDDDSQAELSMCSSSGVQQTVVVFPRQSGSSKSAEPDGGVIEFSLAMLRPKFRMRQADAAKSLGIATSTLKHVCRQLGIERWPWRSQVSSSRARPAAAGGVASGGAAAGRAVGSASPKQSSSHSSTKAPMTENMPGCMPGLKHGDMCASAQRIAMLVASAKASSASSLSVSGRHTVRPAVPSESDDDEDVPSTTLNMNAGRQMWSTLDHNRTALLEEAFDAL